MISVVIHPNKRKITDFLTRRNGERRNGERELKQSVSRIQSSLNANLLKKKKERKWMYEHSTLFQICCGLRDKPSGQVFKQGQTQTAVLSKQGATGILGMRVDLIK